MHIVPLMSKRTECIVEGLRGGGATASLWAGNRLREADDDSPLKDEPFRIMRTSKVLCDAGCGSC